MDGETDVRRSRAGRGSSHAKPGARVGCWMLGLGMMLTVVPPGVSRADGPWGASIAATTNYVLRGVSQTYGGAALQLGATYQHPLGWFAGAWGSNVDPYPSGNSTQELDLYAGLARPLGEAFSVRATYTRYVYVDDPRPVQYDYDDFALSVSYRDRVAATVSYQPDLTSYSQVGVAYRRPAIDYELSANWPLVNRLVLTGGVGYYDLQRLFGASYWAGSAGIAYIDRHVEIDLQRFFCEGTVARLYGDASAAGTVVLSVVLRF